MTTARMELPYPCVSMAKSLGETSRRGMQCDEMAFLSRIPWRNVLVASRVLVICKLETENFVNQNSLQVKRQTNVTG